ncbi:hypothetical protein Bbelb_137790 [Branchiostoma belcheri]|nr:hypothetical protein Bbelb_137790 [Branchiostoma belcheri]
MPLSYNRVGFTCALHTTRLREDVPRCGNNPSQIKQIIGDGDEMSCTVYLQRPLLKEYGPSIAAAYGASTLTKTCSRLAFSKWGRSMGASDLIPEIHPVFEELFETSGPGTPIQRL